MFPIGDDNPGAPKQPVVTILLVAANVLVFLYQTTLNTPQLARFIYTYGAIPVEIERGDDLYTLVTALFVHGGFGHIFGNMLFLWIFADNIERRFGHVRFLLFYLGCGLAAAGAHIAATSGSRLPIVGASGAISGVLGAYALLYPLNRIRVIIWFFGILRVPAFLFLGIWFVTQLANGVAVLSVPTAQSSGVAFWAHVGGFVAGVAGAGLIAAFVPEPRTQRYELALWRDRDS